MFEEEIFGSTQSSQRRYFANMVPQQLDSPKLCFYSNCFDCLEKLMEKVLSEENHYLDSDSSEILKQSLACHQRYYLSKSLKYVSEAEILKKNIRQHQEQHRIPIQRIKFIRTEFFETTLRLKSETFAKDIERTKIAEFLMKVQFVSYDYLKILYKWVFCKLSETQLNNISISLMKLMIIIGLCLAHFPSFNEMQLSPIAISETIFRKFQTYSGLKSFLEKLENDKDQSGLETQLDLLLQYCKGLF